MPEVNPHPRPFNLPLGLAFARRLSFPHKLGILDRVYGRHLARLGTQWVRTWNSKLWKLDLSDVGHRWIVYGVYEGSDWLDWLLPRLAVAPGVVIESGANIGQTLMYYAALPGIQVWAFEPNPVDADWLQECLEANPALQTHVIRCGLANAKSEVELQLYGARSTMIGHWYQDKDFVRLNVPVVRLDDFAAEKDIKRIAFWKLDAEGMELDALKGASGLLASRAIEAILIEAVGDYYAPIKRLLEIYRYTVFTLCARGKLRLAPEQVPAKFQNVVALRNECVR